MRTNARDRWLEESPAAGVGGGDPSSGERVATARAEVEATMQAVSEAAVNRVLSKDHESFLNSVRQAGGQ